MVSSCAYLCQNCIFSNHGHYYGDTLTTKRETIPLSSSPAIIIAGLGVHIILIQIYKSVKVHSKRLETLSSRHQEA